MKETKEIVELVSEILKPILVEVKRDGFQPKDLGAFLSSPGFQAAILPALSGISEVSAELKAAKPLDLAELITSAIFKVLREVE